MYETEEAPEKFILVGVERPGDKIAIEASLDELAALIDTAGALECGRLTQKREGVHPSHYLGKGKIDELRDLMSLTEADGVVCDDELSPAQMRNLSEILDCRVIDRTLLILDIFSERAQSSEGALQVELARLKYNLSHLSGLGKSLSRLGGGGGIGARRGAGEQKLELDRRYLRDKITDLNDEIEQIRTQRKISRDKRLTDGIPVIALVGYTNAGKSTLLNLLTSAGVLAENKLFATLDTTTRKLALGHGGGVLLTDTVGFIRKLPHNLIQAFTATLEELKFSTILVHVLDVSYPQRESHMEVVYETLAGLGCLEKPIITVYNKIDQNFDGALPFDKHADASCRLCALTGEGAGDFLKIMEAVLESLRKKAAALIPYSESRLVAMIHEKCEVIAEEYREDGTYIEFYGNDEMTGRCAVYSV